LAFQVVTELATTLLETPLHQEIKELAAEESYFGYGNFSDYLMLQAFGHGYLILTLSDNLRMLLGDPIFDLQPYRSPILKRSKMHCKRRGTCCS
jgi:hypothetical protein